MITDREIERPSTKEKRPHFLFRLNNDCAMVLIIFISSIGYFINIFTYSTSYRSRLILVYSQTVLVSSPGHSSMIETVLVTINHMFDSNGFLDWLTLPYQCYNRAYCLDYNFIEFIRI